MFFSTLPMSLMEIQIWKCELVKKIWKCETHPLMKGEVETNGKFNMNFKNYLSFIGMWEMCSWLLNYNKDTTLCNGGAGEMTLFFKQTYRFTLCREREIGEGLKGKLMGIKWVKFNPT